MMLKPPTILFAALIYFTSANAQPQPPNSAPPSPTGPGSPAGPTGPGTGPASPGAPLITIGGAVLPETTVGAITLTADSLGDYYLNGNTLSRGGAITVSGVTYSLGPAGMNLFSNGATEHITGGAGGRPANFDISTGDGSKDQTSSSPSKSSSPTTRTVATTSNTATSRATQSLVSNTATSTRTSATQSATIATASSTVVNSGSTLLSIGYAASLLVPFTAAILPFIFLAR